METTIVDYPELGTLLRLDALDEADNPIPDADSPDASASLASRSARLSEVVGMLFDVMDTDKVSGHPESASFGLQRTPPRRRSAILKSDSRRTRNSYPPVTRLTSSYSCLTHFHQSGTISIEEFDAFAQQLLDDPDRTLNKGDATFSEQVPTLLFRLADRDSDGVVSKGELKRVLAEHPMLLATLGFEGSVDDAIGPTASEDGIGDGGVNGGGRT